MHVVSVNKWVVLYTWITVTKTCLIIKSLHTTQHMMVSEFIQTQVSTKDSSVGRKWQPEACLSVYTTQCMKLKNC